MHADSKDKVPLVTSLTRKYGEKNIDVVVRSIASRQDAATASSWRTRAFFGSSRRSRHTRWTSRLCGATRQALPAVQMLQQRMTLSGT